MVMVMAVLGKAAHCKPSEIQYCHWESLAKRSAVDGARYAMLDMMHRLGMALVAVEQRLRADCPLELAHTVFQGVRRHLEQFNREFVPQDEANEAADTQHVFSLQS